MYYNIRCVRVCSAFDIRGDGGAFVKRKTAAACMLGTAMVMSMCGCSYFEKTVTEVIEVDVPPKMVFMGDSIPAGYGLEGYAPPDLYSCRSYPNILGDEYEVVLEPYCGHEMVNVAVTGDTSARLLAHLESGEFDEALAGSNAVIVSIGGNDILEIFLDFMYENVGLSDDGFHLRDVDVWGALTGFGKMDDDLDEALDGFEVNLREIITDLEAKTDGEIYVQTLYDPFEDVGISLLSDMSEEKIGRLNSIIRANAEYGSTHYYTVIDLVGEFEGKSEELTNIGEIDIHPNPEGHAVIAQAVDEHLKKGSYSYEAEKTVTDTRKVKMVIGASSAAALIAVVGIVALVKRRRAH